MIGYGLILLFFIYSVYHVNVKTDAAGFASDAKVITIAHWNCTDDVRAAYQLVFDRFENLKASQGQKVKVIQTSIPGEVYGQWQTTQLIGGNPADMLAIHWQTPQSYINQYFSPLTKYVSQKNPFNKGTVLEELSWRDSTLDGMADNFNPDDYYVVNCHCHLFRFFVNLDVLEKATGSKKMPADLNEFLDVCEKMQQYAERQGKQIVPVACRGADKFTIDMFTRFYFTQLNSVFNDMSINGEASRAEMIRWANEIPEGRERFYSLIGLLRDIGQYFGEGFTSIDNEQVQYLFYSGNAGFYYTGSWETTAMLNEVEFEVGIIPLPVIGENHELSKFYTGPVSESGSWGDAGFGIPKASNNFDLALELLQFLSSYEMNQLFANRCNYLPNVKFAKYEGPLKSFEPMIEGNPIIERIPYSFATWQPAWLKWVQSVENIIIEERSDAVDYFVKNLQENEELLKDELAEEIEHYRRQNFEREKKRSQLSLALLDKNTTAQQAETLKTRQSFAAETYTELTVNGGYLYVKDLLDQASKY